MRIHKSTLIALLIIVYLFIPKVSLADQVLKKINIVSTVDNADISIFLADRTGDADVSLYLTRTDESADKKIYLTSKKSEADYGRKPTFPFMWKTIIFQEISY
jgi:hypothetical protein